MNATDGTKSISNQVHLNTKYLSTYIWKNKPHDSSKRHPIEERKGNPNSGPYKSSKLPHSVNICFQLEEITLIIDSEEKQNFVPSRGNQTKRLDLNFITICQD